MRETRLVLLLIRRIEAYRRSDVAARYAGACHFAPSCSHYGEQALRRRALPVALVLIAWRLLRCRPGVPRGTWDPVPMPSRRTRTKVAGVLLLSGIVTLGTAGLADALVPTGATVGGCVATINGADVTGLNRNHPLDVGKGQRVVVQGLAPQAIRNVAEPAGASTATSIDINLVSPYSYTPVVKGGTGWRTFTSIQNVDTYLKYGSGLYRLTAQATGSAPGQKGYSCSATFYVRLHGSAEAAFGAGLVAAAGFAGAASASGKTDWAVGDVIPPDEKGEGALDTSTRAAQEFTPEVTPDPTGNRRLNRATLACFAVLIAFMFASDGVRLLEPGEENEPLRGALLGAGVAAGGAAGNGGAGGGRRIWRRGHPIRGFIGGLFAGLGLAVVMQQRGYWVLTWANAIAFPLVLAALFGFRGWRGRAFIVTTRPAAEADPV